MIIGVDDDSLVKTNKGENRPFETIEKRIANVVALGLADEIFIKTGSSEDIFETIRLNKYFVPKIGVSPSGGRFFWSDFLLKP